MAARAVLGVGLVTVALVAMTTGCSSGGGGGGGDGGTTGSETGGGGGGNGTGPCAVGTQAQCDECIREASEVCNAGMCKQEDLDLQNCSVISVYEPCTDPTGAPTIDCCKLEGDALIACWRKCPEMKACS